MTWVTLQTTTDSFSEKLKFSLRELGIQDECSKLEIDHICIRIAKETDVDLLKSELKNAGQIISAVNVNGREIMIIQLTNALHLGVWRTNGVELPYPKPNHKYEDGWEHVEFVLEGAENTMNGVKKAFFEYFPSLNAEHLKSNYSYSEDEPHADGDQIPNPTIGLKVNNVGIKFHANPIQKVVGFVE